MCFRRGSRRGRRSRRLRFMEARAEEAKAAAPLRGSPVGPSKELELLAKERGRRGWSLCYWRGRWRLRDGRRLRRPCDRRNGRHPVERRTRNRKGAQRRPAQRAPATASAGCRIHPACSTDKCRPAAARPVPSPLRLGARRSRRIGPSAGSQREPCRAARGRGGRTLQPIAAAARRARPNRQPRAPASSPERA